MSCKNESDFCFINKHESWLSIASRFIARITHEVPQLVVVVTRERDGRRRGGAYTWGNNFYSFVVFILLSATVTPVGRGVLRINLHKYYAAG